MNTFYKIAGAALPPLVGCALAAFSVAILVTSLRALADVFLASPPIRAARCVVAEMRMRSTDLYRGTCRPTAGRLTLAVELWEFADRIDRALGARAFPSAPWRGPVPCHDGRVSGSPTPPREGKA